MPGAEIPSFEVRYTPKLLLVIPAFAAVQALWSAAAAWLDPNSVTGQARFVILGGALATAAILAVPWARTPLQLFYDRVVPSRPLVLRRARPIRVRRGDTVIRVVWSAVPRLSLVYGLEIATPGEPATFVPMVARGSRARRLVKRLRVRCADLGIRLEEARADADREGRVTTAITLAAACGTLAFGIGAGLLTLGVLNRALSGPLAGNLLGVVAVLAYGGSWLWTRGAAARSFSGGPSKPL